MKLISEVEKAIISLITTDNDFLLIPCYLDHAPQTATYPLIVVKYINAPNSYSMGETGGHDYVTIRLQIDIHGNEDQYATIVDLDDKLEDLLHRTTLTLANDVTNICTLVSDTRKFFGVNGEKIWTISKDYKVMAGK